MRLPWSRRAADPEAIYDRPATCPHCQGDEFVALQIAGRIVAGPARRPEFAPTRMRVSCAHCLKTYMVRVDGTGAPQLTSPGPSAGAAGFVANEVVKPEPDEQVRAGDGLFDGIPGNDPGDLVEALRKDPSARLA